VKKLIGRFEAVEKWLESKKYSVIDLKLGNWGAMANFFGCQQIAFSGRPAEKRSDRPTRAFCPAGAGCPSGADKNDVKRP
jgi:hypothetical protein